MYDVPQCKECQLRLVHIHKHIHQQHSKHIDSHSNVPVAHKADVFSTIPIYHNLPFVSYGTLTRYLKTDRVEMVNKSEMGER